MPITNFTDYSGVIINPGMGPEQWHSDGARVAWPTSTSLSGAPTNTLNRYDRGHWVEFEGDTPGSWKWNWLDSKIKYCLDRGMKFSFGIMTYRTETGLGYGEITVGGGKSYVPLHIHNKMQAGVENTRNWLHSSGVWVPNFNHPDYISGLRLLHQAIKDRLLTQYYTPLSGPLMGKRILFADAIYCIDIRGFGTWGEWHSSSGMANFTPGYESNGQQVFPTGRVPTEASLMAIIDAHAQIFDRWWLVGMIAGYNGNVNTSLGVFHSYPKVAHYLLTGSNAKGRFGCRKDQYGATDSYLLNLGENNNTIYNGSLPFKTYYLEKYKYAPNTGEPMPGYPSLNFSALEGQVMLYRSTSIGNGNWGAQPPNDSITATNIRNAFNKLGYRIKVPKIETIPSGNTLVIKTDWMNVGVCPPYEDWDVIFELISSTAVVTKFTSSHKLNLFAPTVSPVTVTDTFTVPTAGTYQVKMYVADPKGVNRNMKLGINGGDSDNKYSAGSVIIGSGTVPVNIGPIANAGGDKEITLPLDEVQIIGTGTDPDGTISSITFTKLSGSGTINIISTTGTGSSASPKILTINVTGLLEGITVLRLSVTDANGANKTDDVNIRVLAAVPTSKIPVGIRLTNALLVFQDGSTTELPIEQP